jgi:hypothetical protein
MAGSLQESETEAKSETEEGDPAGSGRPEGGGDASHEYQHTAAKRSSREEALICLQQRRA